MRGDYLSDFEEMASRREEEAAKLTDLDIWKTVVEKAALLDADTYIKADILLQSIPDVGVIFSQLKRQHNKKNITDTEYHDLLEMLVEKIEKELGGRIDFDPLKYDET
jgi:alpha-amylase/alpha-mannosidase (GH57 family)